MAVVNKGSFSLADAPKRRGPLVRVEISPGRFVKMYQEDAVAAGHIKPGPGSKQRPPAEDKMRLPAENKRALSPGDKAAPAPEQPQAEQPAEPDDFTSIPGIGPATARALKARGIMTFEQLGQAGTLNYVSPQAMQAIEAWRQNG